MNNINNACCKCTVENPTCSCTTALEAVAYRDSNGKLHTSQVDASISSIIQCVRDVIPYRYDSYTPNVSLGDIEKVVKALHNLGLLKI